MKRRLLSPQTDNIPEQFIALVRKGRGADTHTHTHPSVNYLFDEVTVTRWWKITSQDPKALCRLTINVYATDLNAHFCSNVGVYCCLNGNNRAVFSGGTARSPVQTPAEDWAMFRNAVLTPITWPSSPRDPKKSGCCGFSCVAGHDAPVEDRNLTGSSCPARHETVKFNKYRIFDFVGSDGQVGQISEAAGSRRSTGSTGRRKKLI